MRNTINMTSENDRQRLDVLIQLKTQLVNFFDELIESFPKEVDFIVYRIAVNDQIPITTLIDHITEELCPLQELVEKRDEKLFLSHNILFEKLQEERHVGTHINYIKNLWINGKLDKDDKEVLWTWYKLFLSIGLKYIDLKRKK